MEKHIVWKAVAGLLSFLLVCCIALISISYNNLVLADQQSRATIKEVLKDSKDNTVITKVHEARLCALEQNRIETKNQLDNIERLLTRTATIQEGVAVILKRLEEKIDTIEHDSVFGVYETEHRRRPVTPQDEN